jgi:hypothetical protein
LQQLVFSNISIPAPSIGTRGALSKVYGMDSGEKVKVLSDAWEKKLLDTQIGGLGGN